MQKIMQADAAVFRTGQTLAQGIERLSATLHRLPMCACPIVD